MLCKLSRLALQWPMSPRRHSTFQFLCRRCYYSRRYVYSATMPTTGFNAEDSARGPALSTTPKSPPLEVPQSINLSHFYDDAVHSPYRKYVPLLLGLRCTNPEASIRLKCFLKDPKDRQQYSKVVVRREKKIVLEVYLQADSGWMGWKGIALPKTGSVKQPNQQAPTRLLYFSIGVHGSMTGMSLTQPCDNCWRREMRPSGNPHDLPHYLIDFKSDKYVLFMLFLLPKTHRFFNSAHSFSSREKKLCRSSKQK